MTREEAQTLLARYTTRTHVIDRRPHGWNYLTVEILLDGAPIGTYERSYRTLFDTFCPFVQQNEQGGFDVLALYSANYTATRLMRLPDCTDIGGEATSSGGFCPTGFLVPYEPERGLTGQFGFVSGCVWGDDSSWKIHYLDLREAVKGVLRRDARFGYLELPRNIDLYNGSDEYGEIEFTVGRAYLMRTNHFLRDDKGNWIDDEEDKDMTSDAGDENA